MSTQTPAPWRVGDAARHSGLTVRTLHHYEQVGVLRPSQRTQSGHRLYTAPDILRLQQVMSLRRLGMSLTEIRELLTQPETSALSVVELHLERLREQVEAQRQLLTRLEYLATALRRQGEIPLEEVIHSMEVMKMIDDYYTPEQREKISQNPLTADEIRASEVAWRDLILAVRDEMEAGTDPSDPKVQAMAAQWRDLLAAFTQGDPGIQQSLNKMWTENPDMGKQWDLPMDAALMEYIGRAMRV